MHDFLPPPVVFQDARCVHAATEWTPLSNAVNVQKAEETSIGAVQQL